MKIRWKLLLLLLCVSLAPVLLLRLNAQRSMTALGDELASRVAATLIANAHTRLRQLSEMHAELLSRERRALDLALEFQADRVLPLLAGPTPTGDQIPRHILANAPGMGMGGGQGMGRGMDQGKRAVEDQKGNEAGRNFGEFYEAEQSFKLAPGQKPGDFSGDLAKLGALTDAYAPIAEEYPGMILWQATGLASGAVGFYPGPKSLSPGYDVRRSGWYDKALEAKGPHWSPPVVDPASRKLVLVVSAPLIDADGKTLGATAIAVALGDMFGREALLRHVSPSTDAFLVNVITLPDGSKGLRIRARRPPGRGMRPFWTETSEDNLLTTDDAQALSKIMADIEGGQSGILQAPYQGADALWSYSPAWTGSALMIVAPVSDVLAEAEETGAYVHERIQEQVVYTGFLALGFMGLIVLVSIYGSRGVTKHLQSLSRAAGRLANGDFSARADVHGRDEIADLARLFNRVAPQLLERTRMRESLELAMEVQRSLLPAKPPQIPGLDAAAISIYCDETGGDYYDFFTYSGDKAGKLGVAVGDVTGHGVGAALLMTTARALMRPRAHRPGPASEIVADVNRELTADTYGTGRFMTLFYAEIDPVGREIRWVRAGHDPAMLFEPNGGSARELCGPGITLGVIEEAAYEEQSLSGIAPGSALLIGSDGIWEARNASGEMFGKARTHAAVRAAMGGGAGDILEAVTVALDAFRGEAALEDDVTLAVIKFL